MLYLNTLSNLELYISDNKFLHNSNINSVEVLILNFEFTNKSKLFSIVSKFNILESSNPPISFSIEACGSIKTILYFS